jgi:hydrogenase maturation factor
MYILMTNYAAMSGSAVLARRKETELKRKFPKWLLDLVITFGKWTTKSAELKILKDHNASVVLESGDGGVMKTLWDLGEEAKSGFTVDIMDIPIRQETVEICEFFHIDPYRLESKGTYLAVLEDAMSAKAALREIGVESEIIGRLESGNAKVILFDRDHETRYLDKPKPDEIKKVLDYK